MAERPDCAGRSIRELIEDRLDVQVTEIYTTADPSVRLLRTAVAEGLATALALLLNPYRPDVEAVNKTARERYHERLATSQRETVTT